MPVNIYSATSPLVVGSEVFLDDFLLTDAPDGIYCDGTSAYTVSNGVVTAVSAAPSISVNIDSITPESSTGAADGSATLSASGGTAPYEYSKDGGSTWQGGNSFTNLACGSYTFCVRDAGGNSSCSSPSTVPCALSATASIEVQPANPAALGQIRINATGGVPGYTYSKDCVNYQSDNLFIDLSVGSYTFCVKDSAGTVYTLPSTALSSLCNCPSGYTYNSTLGLCELSSTIAATEPTNPTSYTYSSVGSVPNFYNVDGLAILDSGYSSNGTGTATITNTSGSALWSDGNWLPSQGISISGTPVGNEKLAVFRCVSVATARTAYVVISSDNWSYIKINGTTIIDQDLAAMNAQFSSLRNPAIVNDRDTTYSFAFAYPVQLQAGENVIEIGATNSAPDAFGSYNSIAVSAMIFDGTAAELGAISGFTELSDAITAGKVLFRTTEVNGESVILGSDYSDWTCPAGYTLSKCGAGSPTAPVCVLYSTAPCS